MNCSNCHEDAELRVNQERDEYVGTVTCDHCGAVRVQHGDSVAEVLDELEREET